MNAWWRQPPELWSFRLLLAACFFVSFSLPVARVFVVLALVMLAIALRQGGWRPSWRSGPLLPAVLFMLVAVLTAVYGANPEHAVPRLRKLIWWGAFPLAAVLVQDWARLRLALYAALGGAVVLSLKNIVAHPLAAAECYRTGQCTTWASAFVQVGSITDAELLMVGALIGLGLLAGTARPWTRRRVGLVVVLLLVLIGLVVNFKRGSWFCTMAVCTGALAWRARWRQLLALAVVALSLLAVPAVRDRLGGLRSEFRADGGGRATMWLQVAPELRHRYPWGIGYRALTNTMMRDIAPQTEPDRDHLHSNLVQVLVDTGWAGFGFYAWWMGWIWLHAWRLSRPAISRAVPWLGVIPLAVLSALYLNGVVEYNFGDGEIILTQALVFGMVEGLYARTGDHGTAPS